MDFFSPEKCFLLRYVAWSVKSSSWKIGQMVIYALKPCCRVEDCYFFYLPHPSTTLSEKKCHNYCSGGKEISAQVCDWAQGQHPAGDSGQDWRLGRDPTPWQQLRNCHLAWGARPAGPGTHWSVRQGNLGFTFEWLFKIWLLSLVHFSLPNVVEFSCICIASVSSVCF